MKKLLFTITLSLIIGNVFAQKNFNPIIFSKSLTTTGNPSVMDQGVFAKKDSYDNLKVNMSDKSGTILIDANQSTITVKTDLEADKVFKIRTINKEEKDKYKVKTVRISCEDNMAVQYDLIITRNSNSKETNQMIVKIIKPNNDGYQFTCTYLKDLYEK